MLIGKHIHNYSTPKKYVKCIHKPNTSKEYVNTIHKPNTYNKTLRKELVNLLNRYNWDWFTTLTFRYPPTTYTALRKVNDWLITLQRDINRYVGYYITQEKGMLGTVHFHLLMGNLDGVNRKKYWKLWFIRNGAARILPYDPKKGACYYLTKYVIKDEYLNSDTWDIQNLHCLNQLPLDKIK